MRALARLSLAVVALLAITSLLAGITYTTTTAVDVVPAPGGVYSEGLVGRSGVLNPLLTTADQCETDILALVFRGLTRRDENGHIAPDLAEKWSISADGKTYTFALRAGATWHDGVPVTADDVVYTVKAAQSGEAPVVPWLGALWQGVEPRRIDDRTVALTLPSPYAPFLQYTTLGLLPAHVLAGGDEAAQEKFDTQPIGAGPYRVVDMAPSHVVLESVYDARLPAPMIPRLEFRCYKTQSGALQALQAGAVLAVADLSPVNALTLGRTSQTDIHWAPRSSQMQVLFNLGLPFFDDAAVRRALLLAIDRPALVHETLGGKAAISSGIFLSGSWAARPAEWPHDPAGARRLLDQAGWRDVDKDGVRERNGVKLEFALLTSDDPTQIAVAQRIAQAWTALGASLEVQITDAAALVEDYLLPRRFEAALFGWGNLSDDPDPYEMWHSSQLAPAGLNVTGFASQRVDEILEQARQTQDQALRKNLYERLQAIFNEQLPALPLYEPMFAFAASPKVRAIHLSLITQPSDRFRSLGEWFTQTRTITSTQRLRIR